MRRGEIFEEWQKGVVAWLCIEMNDAELAEFCREKFGIERTAAQIKTWRKNRKIRRGLTGYFHTAENPHSFCLPKGSHLSSKTEFKKGGVPLNYLPVGSERTNSDGYTLVKVSDKGEQWERWAFKSRVVWERANGKIPAGMCIVHIDGDKANDDLRNLRLVNRATMQRTVKMGGLCFGREINTAILSLCEMEVKLKNVK